MKAQIAANSGVDPMQQEQHGNEDEDQEPTYVPLRGPLPRTDGVWASCVRVVEPASGETHCLMELTDNEAAFSVCTCKFTSREEETYLIVGTAKDLTLHPRNHKGCFIHVYRLVENSLQLLHKTEVEDVPLAMCEFKGRRRTREREWGFNAAWLRRVSPLFSLSSSRRGRDLFPFCVLCE